MDKTHSSEGEVWFLGLHELPGSLLSSFFAGAVPISLGILLRVFNSNRAPVLFGVGMSRTVPSLDIEYCCKGAGYNLNKSAHAMKTGGSYGNVQPV